MEKIRIGIVGYGNIGKGVEAAIRQNPDMELVVIFTRRDPESIGVTNPRVKVERLENIPPYKSRVDVLILCGGSLCDLPQQGPALACGFNTVDSFDTHAKIPEYLAAMSKSASAGGKVALVSCGWDPGLFSMMRLLGGASLPVGSDYTFWGRGVSQGHSDAVRRVEGVQDAIQYTVPVAEAVEAVRKGEEPALTTRQKHTRECYVVAKPETDTEKIKNDITSMPNYFAEYDTSVEFISLDELRQNHGKMPHAGFVFRSGMTGDGINTQIMEFALKLDSNPEFTANVLVAFARAAHRLYLEGKTGGYTPFDIPPYYLHMKSREQLIKEML